MIRLVIDTDPGVDDAHAILLAAAHPDVRIEAITTVVGNNSLEHTTDNACKILDLLGLETPVYRGSPRPLVHPANFASYFHGEDGLGDSGYPPSTRRVESEHAALALIRLAAESPGELTLAAIGPLTNLALAMRLDPQLPGMYKDLMVMGGAVRAMGNTQNHSAEFNFWTDPEAAHIVLDGWPGVQLLPWETAVEHTVPQAQVDRLMAVDSLRGEFFRRITAKVLQFTEKRLGAPQLFAPDGLAIAAAIEPGFVLHREERHVRVELAGAITRGQSTVDWYGQSVQQANVSLVLDIDDARFLELLHAALA
ncbi:MAG TPA: nucleoside hydrolase [Anaerolineales bacterium]|nr:nucleoside hydrolase [Anaerolineales bacterium]